MSMHLQQCYVFSLSWMKCKRVLVQHTYMTSFEGLIWNWWFSNIWLKYLYISFNNEECFWHRPIEKWYRSFDRARNPASMDYILFHERINVWHIPKLWTKSIFITGCLAMPQFGFFLFVKMSLILKSDPVELHH